MTIHATAAHAIRPEPAMYDLASEPEVRDVMRPGVVAVPEDASLRQVRRAMLQREVTHLLVRKSSEGMPEGMPEGTLSELDLLAYGRW